ncbi:YeeE/YedE family protein [Cupriavidus sp. RAF12]|uniref:YeeE/YedE family protein n=1 Tax=Cupriavidus sp. RAF12 TaxID=3233050 RepID=UPI003F8F9902
MTIDFVHFTPGPALAGGLIIGTAAAVLVLCNGRIAGISGILGGLLGGLRGQSRGDRAWRAAFLAGLIGAPLLTIAAGLAPEVDIEAGWTQTLVAGFIVGVGTRYAGGCTSGHGVCGMSRGSVRSIVATVTFMAAGFLTVFVQRHIFGG